MHLIKEFFDFSALNTSKKLENIINSNNREHDLREFAKEIGAASPLPISNTTAQNENKLITLIINARRLAREENLWKLAFLSVKEGVGSGFTASQNFYIQLNAS